MNDSEVLKKKRTLSLQAGRKKSSSDRGPLRLLLGREDPRCKEARKQSLCLWSWKKRTVKEVCLAGPQRRLRGEQEAPALLRDLDLFYPHITMLVIY